MPHVIRGAERTSTCEECQHIHEKQLRKLHTLTTQQSRTISKVQKSRSWSVLDRAVRRMREPCIVKEQQIEDLDLLFSRCCKHVMDTFQCTVIKKSVCVRWCTVSTERLGLPTRVPAVERSQTNGPCRAACASTERAFTNHVQGRKTVQC